MKELVTIQQQLKAPKKNRNSFGGYNYRSCEDILEAVKPICHEAKCFITITDDMVSVGDRIYVKATATIHNAEGLSFSVSAFAREEEIKKGMDAAQITGSASSYARKYALNGLLAIDDTRDPDAQTPAQPQQTAPSRKTITSADLDDVAKSNKMLDWAFGQWSKVEDKTTFNAGALLAKHYEVNERVKNRFAEMFDNFRKTKTKSFE